MKQAQLTNLLGALAVALTDAQSGVLAEVGELGTSASAAMMTLGPHSGLSIHAMSEVLGLSHSATVRVIDQLVERELVERARGADRRLVTLRLTSAGQRVRARLAAARCNVIEACLVDWSPRDRNALGKHVSRLLEALAVGRRQGDRLCRLCDETVCGPEICPVEQRVIHLEALRDER